MAAFTTDRSLSGRKWFLESVRGVRDGLDLIDVTKQTLFDDWSPSSVAQIEAWRQIPAGFCAIPTNGRLPGRAPFKVDIRSPTRARADNQIDFGDIVRQRFAERVVGTDPVV